MSDRRERAEATAREYTQAEGPLKLLGGGIEGFVFSIGGITAVKAFEHRPMYQSELAAYQRLRDVGIEHICGLHVPVLVNLDDRLMVIEMSIVDPPFLLDFAQTTLDHPRDFSEDVMTDWWNRVAEMFGERFEDAREVFYALQDEAGIYYYDLAPRNVNFGGKT